jgi:phage terminase large subunit-like protein
MSALADSGERQILKGKGEQVARFAETFIVNTKGRWAGKPLIYEPWQRSLMDELYLQYDDGERVYTEALVGVGRKAGKSTWASSLALHALIGSREGSPEVYVAAAARDQARIVFGQAADFVKASPKLRDWLTVQRSAILCKSNGGVLRVLSSDAGVQYGLNPSMVIIDELAVHKNPELYYALTTGQLARQSPLVVSITTAGWDRDNIAFSLYQRGKELEAQGVAAMRRGGFLFKWWEADPMLDIMDEEGWQQANPSSWVRMQDLRREAERLPGNVFRRLHLNQWTEAEDAWIAPSDWDVLRGPAEIDRSLPTWMAVDVGIKRDSAAIVWGQWYGERLHIRQRLLLPENEGPKFGVADVRAAVADFASGFDRLREIAYDPFSFRESAEILLERGLNMVEFPQTAGRMAPASETVYELIVGGRLEHDGERTMRDHVLSAVTAPTDRGGWRISKRKSLARIDGAISLTMCADRAVTMRHVKTRRPATMFA